MPLADSVADVLRAANGGPLHYREITRRAISLGALLPGGATPWASVNAAINLDNRRRRARGEHPRFEAVGGGFYRLVVALTEVERVAADSNERVLSSLLGVILKLDPDAFEELLAALLRRVGFEDIEVTGRSGDRGVDLRATLTVGGVASIRTAIQAKRWQRPVSGKVVRELRGSLRPREQGLVITTSRFTRDAHDEALESDKAPIALVDGRALVKQLAEYDLGIRRSAVTVFALDESVALGKEPAAAEIGGPPHGALFRALWPLPGGTKNYAATLKLLLADVVDRPQMGRFIARMQRRFPQVHSESVARGYARVLAALGFADIAEDRIGLAASGRDLLDSSDMALLRRALTERIVGVREILQALGKKPRSKEELSTVLRTGGIMWQTNAQLGYRISWLLAAGLIAQDGDQYRLSAEPVS